MRFLLVSPGRGAETPARLLPRAGGAAVTTQGDHDLRYLGHELAQVGEVELLPDPAIAAAVVRDARVHSVLGLDVLVADVDVELATASGTADWEAALTGVATQIAAASGRPGLAQLRWVARYGLGDAAEWHTPGWLGGDAKRIPLRADGGPAVHVGWANGQIDGWDELAAGERWDTVAGLVDAQALWCQLEDVNRIARDELEELYLEPASTSLAGKSRRLVIVNASAQMHNLCAGELVSGVQGRRRDVALGTLDVWRFEQLRDQVNRDIEAAMSHTEALQRIRSVRYQRAVEGVLLALTLVSAIGLVLSFISVAFLNDTSRRADDGPVDLPLLELFRTDADLVLIISGLVLLAVAIGLLALQWRRDRGVRR